MFGKGITILGFLLSFGAGMALMYVIDSSSGGGDEISKDTASEELAPGAAWSDSESPIPVSSKDPTWGNRSALVTIVEFSDYQCPFCSRVNPTLDALKEKYGPDKVRIVWKHAPIVHKNAKNIHAASAVVHELGGNDAFWKFHDAAFKNGKASEAQIEEMVTAVGVDAAKFKAKMKDGLQKVEEDLALATKVGIRGTPGFLINGELLSGAQPLPKFEAAVQKALAQAEGLVKKGTKADAVYVAASKANFKVEPPKKREPPKPVGPVYVALADYSPRKGPKHAKVTVMEFLDFQ